jgi:hypothetical protein
VSLSRVPPRWEGSGVGYAAVEGCQLVVTWDIPFPPRGFHVQGRYVWVAASSDVGYASPSPFLCDTSRKSCLQEKLNV